MIIQGNELLHDVVMLTVFWNFLVVCIHFWHTFGNDLFRERIKCWIAKKVEKKKEQKNHQHTKCRVLSLISSNLFSVYLSWLLSCRKCVLVRASYVFFRFPSFLCHVWVNVALFMLHLLACMHRCSEFTRTNFSYVLWGKWTLGIFYLFIYFYAFLEKKVKSQIYSLSHS